jgi:hypothetical protein
MRRGITQHTHASLIQPMHTARSEAPILHFGMRSHVPRVAAQRVAARGARGRNAAAQNSKNGEQTNTSANERHNPLRRFGRWSRRPLWTAVNVAVALTPCVPHLLRNLAFRVQASTTRLSLSAA